MRYAQLSYRGIILASALCYYYDCYYTGLGIFLFFLLCVSAAACVYMHLLELFLPFFLISLLPLLSFPTRPSGLRHLCITIRPTALSFNSVYTPHVVRRHVANLFAFDVAFSFFCEFFICVYKCLDNQVSKQNIWIAIVALFFVLFALLAIVTTGRLLSRLPKWKWAWNEKQHERKWETGHVDKKEEPIYIEWLEKDPLVHYVGYQLSCAFISTQTLLSTLTLAMRQRRAFCAMKRKKSNGEKRLEMKTKIFLQVAVDYRVKKKKLGNQSTGSNELQMEIKRMDVDETKICQ